MRVTLFLTLLTVIPAFASAATPSDRATYDVTGRLTSLLQGGAKLAVQQNLVVTFTGGVTASVQPEEEPPALIREADTLYWHGSVRFPNASTTNLTLNWLEPADSSAVTLDAALTPPSTLDTQSVDCLFDLPRADFAGGQLRAATLPTVPLPTTKPPEVTFFSGTTDTLTFTTAETPVRTLTCHLYHPLPVTVTDRWDNEGRSFRVRVTLRTGPCPGGETLKFHATLDLTGPEATAPAVTLHVDPTRPLYEFDGYGGNYCWGGDPAVSAYLFDHLQHAWTRHELKAIDWDQQRDQPGPALLADFQQMQTMQARGIPWILSVWRLPQRFYADANQRPPGTFFHPVAWDKWDDLLDLVGSYLLYLKTHYHTEPDLFSFNEPDLGIYVGQTPETHRDAIQSLGAHFAKLGLKTRLLLGDTSDARGTHRFILPAAADPEAMRYVGALSFHAWRETTPAQYEAWADLATWLKLPLLVAEAGVDPGAYHNQAFDSYDYGLSEMAQQQALLRFAHPSASIFWQYTTDYGLVRTQPDGTVAPTSRFWLLKHFTDLTPRHSQVLASASDQPDVLISAFRRDDAFAIHVLNLGPARAGTLSDLPPGVWQTVTTTDTVNFAEGKLDTDHPTTLNFPARSLTTLLRPTSPAPSASPPAALPALSASPAP